MHRRLSKAWIVVAGVLTACNPSSEPVEAQSPAQRSPTPRPTDAGVRVETVATGLERPWGLAFLPDGRMLVTEKAGRLRLVAPNGTVSAPLAGVPSVYAQGQGGLLDVAVDPQFAENRYVYLTYAEPDGEGRAGTSAARARLGDGRLENVEVIYRQTPKLPGGGHYGSRIVFSRDGKVFVTSGDRQVGRDRVQDLSQGQGKIVRINTDGSIPRDNPFVNRQGAIPAIWSTGHRNLQGAALHPETGQLWTVEHGPQGGDELNHPEAGKNYGWPVITYGEEYGGGRIGEGTARAGMEQPVYYWAPVIAPGGMTFYTGDAFPEWKGDILIGSLTPGGLVRLEMSNGRVTNEVRYLGSLNERIRDVQQGPDGFVYLVTDNPRGRVLRVRPN